MIFSAILWQKLFLLLAFALLYGGANAVFAQDETAPSATTQFEQGQDAHERGDVAAALKFYEKAIELHPEFPEAEYQRGAALQQLGREAEAAKAFRRAIALRADWSLPMAKLGALLIKQNNLAEAESILNKALEIDAANSAALAALAELAVNSKTAPEQRLVLLQKIRANTDGKANAPVALWIARSVIERSLGDVTAAKTSINRALQIEPNSISARLMRGEIILAENDFAAALDDAKFALHNAPDNLPGRLLLSRIYAAEGDLSESLKILDALAPEQQKLLAVVELRKAVLLNSASGTDNIAALEKLLVSDAQNVAAISRLCALTRTVNPSQSLLYCRRAAELEPQNLAHAVGYGAALVQARQFDNAINVLRRVLTVASDNYTARANLATALYEAKRFPEAITEFDVLLTAKPDVPASYFFLATSHDALGNFVEAMAAYQKFLTIADSNRNQLEIDKVKLRLPTLQRQIEKGAGRKKSPERANVQKPI